MEKEIHYLSLENAIQFKGKANLGAVLGKLIQKHPKVKKDIPKYKNLIQNTINQINKMSHEKQKKEILKLNPKALEKKEKKQEKKDKLPKLQNTDKGVVVRFAPAPSGHLHIGHLFGIVANFEIKKKYKGKFYLRLEDTNPKNTHISNYKKVIEDVKWLCDDKIDKIYYQSDRMEIYLKVLKKLFQLKKAYVCLCSPKDFKNYTDKKTACPHRKLKFEEQQKLFKKFIRGDLKQAVVRHKADLQNKNPALRSFALARIDKTPHPRVGKKFCVWPNYNLSVSVDDKKMGITHVIRGKDLEIGEVRQKMIFKDLNWKPPNYFHFGRLKFTDLELSKTKLSQKIKEGEFEGWDDVRIPSILSHKKRGYKAEALRKYILNLGISKRDSKISAKEFYKGLNFFNKQIIEEISNRAFFIENPTKLILTNSQKIPIKQIKLQKHPSITSKGERKFNIEKEYFIEEKDFKSIKKQDIIRLKQFGNFKITSKTKTQLRAEFISKAPSKKVKKTIHYLPKNQKYYEKCSIIMPDNTHKKGIVEKLGKISKDTSLQFERFGFVRFEKTKNQEKLFYFTQK